MPQKTVSIVIEVGGADDAIRRVRQMRSALDDLGRGGAESMIPLRRQSREVTQAMKEMEKTFRLRQLQKEMLGDLEDFFGRIISGARTTGDLFKNIWREIADFFKRTILEMAAAWTLNLGGLFPLLSGSSSGFSGLGRLDGSRGFGTFGGGPGGGGLGVGGGAAAARIAQTAPTLAATLGLPATTPLGDILERLRGIGPFSGPQVALAGLGLGALTIGNRNRIVSAFGGLGSGALLGFSAGGPIGAVVGGIIGGIVGLFRGGGGKEKRHDAEIANQGFAQLRQILEDYQRFRRDFASSMDAAHQVYNRMVAQFVRKESEPSQRPFFEAIIRSMEGIEDERNRRRQLLSLMSVPEFQAGGLVAAPSLSRLGSGTLGILHPGEFVMNRAAVERLGVSLLDGLNHGSSSASSAAGVSLSIEPASAQTLGEMLKRNPQALEEGLLVVLRRGGTASRALRG